VKGNEGDLGLYLEKLHGIGKEQEKGVGDGGRRAPNGTDGRWLVELVLVVSW